MQKSIIKKSDIDKAHRFDAEYFRPKVLSLIQKIKSREFIEIGKSFDVTKLAGFEYTKYFTEQNMSDDEYYLALTSLNIQNENLVKEGALKIKKSVADKFLNRSKLESGDVVLSYTGEYRRALTILENNYQLGPNICLLRNIDDAINPFYLSTYFNSSIGQTLLDREKTLSGQPTVAMSRIRKILIPVLQNETQDLIKVLILTAKEKQQQSKKLYREAEELLLHELGLMGYRPKHRLSFTTSKSKVDKAKRYDAEYFQPKYAEIIEKIEKYRGGWEYVGSMLNWKKGIEVGSDAYTEQGKDFVRVSDFSKFGIENVSKKIDERLFETLKDEHQPNIGEILFTKDGTIGISYVLKEEIEGVLSGAFLRLTKKHSFIDFETEVISLIFNSILTKMQVNKLSGGALIAHLKPSDFDKFKIPLIDQQIQKQITEKIIESHKLRKESKNLLEKAKKMVEDEIEKSDN